jgi:hypothetical protein
MPPPPPTLSRAGSNELLERRSSQNKAVQDRFKQFISKEYVISDQNGADTQPYNNITISDDHSEGSAIKKRKLIAAASEKGEMSMTRNRVSRIVWHWDCWSYGRVLLGKPTCIDQNTNSYVELPFR